MDLSNYNIIVVGCGLSGVVIAERFSLLQNKKILIIDKRNHIGGNCYDYYDKKTNILMNKYGAHLFHTNHEDVFSYINKYGKWSPWEHKVLGMIDDKYLPIPPNITTVNEIFNLNIKNKEEMNKWLLENQVKFENITNGEEMAKSRVGEVLYEKIFKHYTYKQWKKYPNELAPEVLARIPVRNSFDNRYFSDKYQVLPEGGYTAFFQKILDKHKDNIDVELNCNFFDIKDNITKDHIVIYTGPIDAYFADKGLPKLEYRSINFHIEHKMNTYLHQPYSVVNYPGSDTHYTRCVEYKHFLNQKSKHTVYVKETTTDVGEPYYPVLNERNKQLYAKYQKMAENEGENIHFIGRLASYKYFNMDQAIKNSLDYYKKHFEQKKNKISLNYCKKNFEQKITLIISRYNEKLNWVNKIKDNDLIEKIIIYNKGKNNIILDDPKIFILLSSNNIGREGGTYLDYIIENYGNFKENLIFTQADPFEHNTKFLDFFKDENIPLYLDKNILPLTKQWKVSENIPPQKFVKHNNSYNIGNLELIKYFVRDFDQQVIGHSSFNDRGVSWNFKLFKKIYKTENEMKTVCDFIGIENSKKIIPICWSACFFVKSKQIMRHPKKVYVRLRKFLYASNDQGGIQGYLLERFWYYLFTGESYDTIDDSLKELFVDIEPLIKIYCNKRKKVWFKNINDCKRIIEDSECYIIYTKKNGKQKILPGVDYVGPDTFEFICNDIEEAKITNLNYYDKIYFYIRGHIRNSFQNKKLFNFVKKLKYVFPNIIFILQTWNHKECKKNESWKYVKKYKEFMYDNNDIITKSLIEKYFENLNILENCLIIDDENIDLVGSIDGTIGIGPCPKKGWKNMWYGKYKGIKNINFDDNSILVSFRYDFFDILGSNCIINEYQVIDFIKKNLKSEDIIFYNELYQSRGFCHFQKNLLEVDNLYLGPPKKIKLLTEKFYFHLDDILKIYNKVEHQEFLVYLISKDLKLDGMNRNHLKLELKNRGLSIDGKKRDLKKRLKKSIKGWGARKPN